MSNAYELWKNTPNKGAMIPSAFLHLWLEEATVSLTETMSHQHHLWYNTDGFETEQEPEGEAEFSLPYEG